jgi:hypothetical protein
MTIKPDDLRRCLRVYEIEVEEAARLHVHEVVDIETTYRHQTEQALRDHKTKVLRARESFEANLKDAGLE